MSTITTTSTAAALPATSHSRITVDQYDRMIEWGELEDGGPIELIDGMLVPKMSKSPEHRHSNKAIFKAFVGILPSGYIWQMGGPIRIPNFDEPEPDFAIVRGTDDDYETRHPGAADVPLVVEVAVTSLGDDRRKKLTVYAGAGIPVYWIVNIKERQIEVYTEPRPGDYKSRVNYTSGQFLPVVIDGSEVDQIAVDDILPRQAAVSGE
jgi:Uma2 family endonuclease